MVCFQKGFEMKEVAGLSTREGKGGCRSAPNPGPQNHLNARVKLI